MNAAKVITEAGERLCAYSGGLSEPGRFGGVCAGDWVRLDETGATIESILPRRTYLARRAAGPVEREQLVAANIDTVFIMTSMNDDFNPSRIERYLAAVATGGAEAVICVTKCDLAGDRDAFARAAEDVARGRRVLLISSKTGEGFSELEELMAGKTSAFVGMSGVGKSSVINRISGSEIMRINGIREDDSRGRHTTTHRELIALHNGATVVDTPGMRTMGLWESGGLDTAYPDIASLKGMCRFRDCTHSSEPGCAVKAAILSGELDARRLRNYQALTREDARARVLETRKAKAAGKHGRAVPRKARRDETFQF